MMRILFVVLLLLSSQMVSASVIPTAPHVYVEGHHTMEVSPDQVRFSINISHTDLDAEKAKQNVEKRLSNLLILTAEMGIGTDDITASPYQISPAWEWQGGKRNYKGTDVSVTVYLMLNDVSRYATLLNVLVKADITSVINSQAMLKNEDQILQQVRKLALADARKKADDLAQMQGKNIKDVHSISEFNTRQDDRYKLVPDAEINGNALTESIKVQGYRSEVSDSVANLKMGTMRASATVYVVYLLE